MNTQKERQTFAIIVHTQVLENYGDAEKPHWKLKPGEAYWVANVESGFASYDLAPVARNLPNIDTVEQRDSNMWIEYVTRTEVVEVQEAVRRSSIRLEDCDPYNNLFFERVRKADGFECYSMPG